MASRPLKPAMPVAQQIALLRERGMAIDEGLARQWFANVSYYRLSAYWHPARRLNGRGERSDTFIDGTTFSDVAALYEADRKLRTFMHDGMERIEITRLVLGLERHHSARRIPLSIVPSIFLAVRK